MAIMPFTTRRIRIGSTFGSIDAQSSIGLRCELLMFDQAPSNNNE